MPIRDDITKQFGRDSLVMTDESPARTVDALSTGIPGLNDALKIKGYPRGAITQVYGPASPVHGSMALRAIREAQQAGGIAAILDAGHDFDVAQAIAMGCDVSRLLVSQPESIVQTFDLAEVLTRSGAVDLIVVSDLAALAVKDMAEEGLDLQCATDVIARRVMRRLQTLAGIAPRTHVALLFLTPLSGSRDPVGNSLKFYSSVRIDVSRPSDDGAVLARVVKNKFAPPFKSTRFALATGETVDLAVE